jgi:hypothetical protein
MPVTSYLSALAELHQVGDPQERRRLWRQATASLVLAASRGPAPLEGFDPEALLASTRMALADGLLQQLDWLSAPAAAVVTLELASALPSGAERRELGRRVLVHLREGNRETFLALATALAQSSPRALGTAAVRARLEVVLASPLAAPGGVGALALALVSRPELARIWLEKAATGALADRRLASRILAHAAREAVIRGGDNVEALQSPVAVAALHRLIADREALVWRFAAVARGLLAHADPAIAGLVDRDLRASGDPKRRALTSAAAALERGGAASRWLPELLSASEQDTSLARCVVQGLAGMAATDPDGADQLATRMVQRGGLDTVDALVELFREEGGQLLPRAAAAAMQWLSDELLHDDDADDGRVALLTLMRAELLPSSVPGPLASQLIQVRADLDQGQLTSAISHARDALEEVGNAVEWLERASEDESIERRHALRTLREIDRELLSDGTLAAALALAGDTDPASKQLGVLLSRLELAMLDRERVAEFQSAVPNYRLRLARLRALVRILDSDILAADPSRREQRLRALTLLMGRAATDISPLRRAVWAALTRTWDAIIRDEEAEISDLLLCLSSCFDPDENFAVVREATMVPDVEAVLAAYQGLAEAVLASADPGDTATLLGAVDRLAQLARALPRAGSPRVAAVRVALAQLATALGVMTRASGLSAIPIETLDNLTALVTTLGQAMAGARRRVGLGIAPGAGGGADPRHELSLSCARAVRGGAGAFDTEGATAIDAVTCDLSPAVADLVGRVLTRIARIPVVGETTGSEMAPEATLPTWLPLSRTIGGFYVMRPIATGGGGSVFVACRSEERALTDAEQLALKVPAFDGGAARSLSEQEFESMFREEAGALLSVPPQENLAGFVTFDARARPKPILVMEYVRGPTLERVLDLGDLDITEAFSVIDGIAAGLGAMHQTRVAHLDLKPQNVIIRGERQSRRIPVLVDFGLAGRKLRPGCGSPHYGAPEVWGADTSHREPFPTDVYAFTCMAFELLTSAVLVSGESLKEVLDYHLEGKAAAFATAHFSRHPEWAPLVELFRAGLSVNPEQRPPIQRLRAGFAAVVPELARQRWPLVE